MRRNPTAVAGTQTRLARIDLENSGHGYWPAGYPQEAIRLWGLVELGGETTRLRGGAALRDRCARRGWGDVFPRFPPPTDNQRQRA